MDSQKKISFEDYLKTSSDIPEDTYLPPYELFSDSKRRFDYSLLLLIIFTALVVALSLCFVYNTLEPIDTSARYTAHTAQQYISSQTKGGKVNINTADADALCTLEGIGEEKAFNILSYRLANGDFKTIEDIMKVKNIGPEAFKKIKNKICV